MDQPVDIGGSHNVCQATDQPYRILDIWDINNGSGRALPALRRLCAAGSFVVAPYRLYQLDKAGHVAGAAIEFEAQTDSNAIDMCKTYFSGHAMELWTGTKLIGQFSEGETQAASVILPRTPVSGAPG